MWFTIGFLLGIAADYFLREKALALLARLTK